MKFWGADVWMNMIVVQARKITKKSLIMVCSHLLECGYAFFFFIVYSAGTRTMNAMAFFHFICKFLTYSVVFYIFPELTNHIHEPKQWHRYFFSCFPCFLLSDATLDTLFGGKKAEKCLGRSIALRLSLASSKKSNKISDKKVQIK